MSNTASVKPRVAKGRRYIGSEIVFNVILTIFVLLCILPVIHVIAKSISGRAPVVAGKVYLLPKEIDFNAYASVFNDPTMIRSMWFSIEWTVIYTALAMVSTILLAYPLSRHYLPGRRFLMIVVLIPMYFVGQADGPDRQSLVPCASDPDEYLQYDHSAELLRIGARVPGGKREAGRLQ